MPKNTLDILICRGEAKKRVAVIAVLVMIFGACAAQRRPLENTLQGEWLWKRSVDSYTGYGSSSSTPETCRCSKRLVFTKGHHVEIYKGDTLISKSTFLLKQIAFLQDPLRYVIESDQVGGDIQVEKDTLTLGTTGTCGRVEYYYRNSGKARNKKK